MKRDVCRECGGTNTVVTSAGYVWYVACYDCDNRQGLTDTELEATDE
jgi:hypothetical protein